MPRFTDFLWTTNFSKAKKLVVSTGYVHLSMKQWFQRSQWPQEDWVKMIRYFFCFPIGQNQKTNLKAFTTWKGNKKIWNTKETSYLLWGQFQKLTRFILEPSSTRLRKLPNQQEDQGNEKPQAEGTFLDTFFHALKKKKPKGYTHTIPTWIQLRWWFCRVTPTKDPTDAIFFVRATLTASWWWRCGSQKRICKGRHSQWDFSIMGPLTRTFCHTTPIRIPKDMGMVWGKLTIRGSHYWESLEWPLTQAASNFFYSFISSLIAP